MHTRVFEKFRTFAMHVEIMSYKTCWTKTLPTVFLQPLDQLRVFTSAHAPKENPYVLSPGEASCVCKLVIDKLLAVGKRVWIVSLDLSKAFDRVNWFKLWAALASHGVSQHLVWIIQCLYWKQVGCVKGETDLSNSFSINFGLRRERPEPETLHIRTTVSYARMGAGC